MKLVAMVLATLAVSACGREDDRDVNVTPAPACDCACECCEACGAGNCEGSCCETRAPDATTVPACPAGCDCACCHDRKDNAPDHDRDHSGDDHDGGGCDGGSCSGPS